MFQSRHEYEQNKWKSERKRVKQKWFTETRDKNLYGELIMDTDDLLNEAYTLVIVEAEKFNHDLTLQFGILAYSCRN